MLGLKKSYDVIVVGAGHAGCEAALAAARRGADTLVITQSVERIGVMSCNPAVGGTAKGHLVKEIDALGGMMARAIDATGLQFRVLNRKKGPAIWSSRAQADMGLYARFMKQALENQPGLSIRQDSVEGLLVEPSSSEVRGVSTKVFGDILAKAVVITSGTFLNGLIHIGQEKFSAGRAGDPASIGLAQSLSDLSLRMGRMKTGTTPRLDARTIQWERLEAQHSDEDIIPFSTHTEAITQKLIPCHITHTTEQTHQIISEHLHHSPLYSGEIKGIGPRYCPSIEDKVVKFKDRLSHQVFLEPQGYDSSEIYPNGLSTSLPLAIQYHFIRSIPGLREAEIIRPGYAIEYDYVDPTELNAHLAVKKCPNLYLAGQINGTTGYEEAAAQGLIAGLNASLRAEGRDGERLLRSQAYIGVMIDDLVTKGTSEPYRMFTSRAEYRLLLREDNADLRLTPFAHDLGLVSATHWQKFTHKKSLLDFALAKAQDTLVGDLLPPEYLSSKDNRGTRLSAIIKKPQVEMEQLACSIGWLGELPKDIQRRLAIELRYEGYIQRELREVERALHWERLKIPQTLSFETLPGLSREVVEKLAYHRPETLGMASRISGMTPAALQMLQVHIKNHHSARL